MACNQTVIHNDHTPTIFVSTIRRIPHSKSMNLSPPRCYAPARVRSGVFALLLLLAPLAHALHPAERVAHQAMESGDWAAARSAFVEAAQAGSPTAMAHLGWFHEAGHGVEVSHPLAVIWYTQAIAAGGEPLALQLAWLHLRGAPLVRSRELAEHWFYYAIARGDLEAHIALASVLIADAQGGIAVERIAEARQLLQVALQEGERVLASYFLARLHLEGIGTPVDRQAALPYLCFGSERGDVQMQTWLAQFYPSHVACGEVSTAPAP